MYLFLRCTADSKVAAVTIIIVKIPRCPKHMQFDSRHYHQQAWENDFHGPIPRERLGGRETSGDHAVHGDENDYPRRHVDDVKDQKYLSLAPP